MLEKTLAGKQWQKVGIKHHHGINIPLFSLHSQHSSGIGEYPDLIPLIRWCKNIGFDVIQLLPLNDTGWETSPYSALSAFALNFWHLGLYKLPFLKDFPSLQARAKQLRTLCHPQRIHYSDVFKEKEAFLRDYDKQASHLITSTHKYKQFIEENQDWLTPYAEYKDRQKKGTKTHEFLQYLCHLQLTEVKEYAEQEGIFLKGDIPILINRKSVDVCSHPQFFLQHYSAGSPPDRFTPQGQNWDFPLYNWEALEQDHYDWWKRRLNLASQYFHIYRLDHIVGFYRIFAIPEGLSAYDGIFIPEDEFQWVGHGEKILTMMLKSCPMLPIGEDLAIIPNSIRKSLQKLGICGTRIMRWERKSDGTFIPLEQYIPESMTSVSTHDAETLPLWWQHYPNEAKAFANFKQWEYTEKLDTEKQREILWDSHHTASFFHINLLNEYLSLIPGMSWPDPNDERINFPGTVSERNWTYRLRPSIEEIVSNKPLQDIMKSMLQ